MSVFQTELDVATISFDETLEKEIQSLFQTTNATIATAESVSNGIIGKALKRTTNATQNYLGTIICNHPKTVKHFFGWESVTIKPFCEQMTAALAKGITSHLQTDIGMACTGTIGYPDENNICRAKIVLAYFFYQNERTKVLELIGTEKDIYKQILQASFAYLKSYFVKYSTINKNKETINYGR
ncbi:hypothetical protein DID76_00225 [Candidatus Marinamargulisbacteria bacterium SCGC AG-414-C22]|nr:hypothetical protein DID76_00225 [Candidatus Marinamargulisbacteria bacterium SCGC AG-414-C22]